MIEVKFTFKVTDADKKIVYGETEVADFEYEYACEKLAYRLAKLSEKAPKGLCLNFAITYVGNNALEKLKNQVEIASEKYSPDNVDIVYDEDSDRLSIVYHDNHNSFLIEDMSAKVLDCSTNDVAELANNIGCGYCNLDAFNNCGGKSR